ncbi:unnamed protein product [Rotaria sp. Silwood1]|nr:unnamed protein product [Rotaria sp. Silwood1]
MCSTNSCSSSGDIIDITEETCSDSRNVDHTSSNISQMSCKRIYNLLMRNDGNLIVVDNTKKHTASCRSQFGFPAVTDDKGVVLTKLDNFVSCKHCYVTYSYNNNSTSQTNKHFCGSSPIRSSKHSDTTSSSPLKQKKFFLSPVIAQDRLN